MLNCGTALGYLGANFQKAPLPGLVFLRDIRKEDSWARTVAPYPRSCFSFDLLRTARLAAVSVYRVS